MPVLCTVLGWHIWHQTSYGLVCEKCAIWQTGTLDPGKIMPYIPTGRFGVTAEDRRRGDGAF